MTQQKNNNNEKDRVPAGTHSDIKVFRVNDSYANMDKERLVVPQNSTLEILSIYELPEEIQKTAVSKLVDRTPHWLDLSEEEQKNEIKAVLTLESVAYYLYEQGTIRETCSLYENGFDKDGNVVIDAFYVDEEDSLREIKQKANQRRKERIIDFQDAKNRREK